MNTYLLAYNAATDASDGYHAATLLLRVVVGITFAAHGYNKFFGGGKIPGTARWFDSIGMKPSGLVHAYVSAVTELGAGLLLALGLLTPLAGAGMVGIMVVAAYTVNRPNGFFSANHGWEYNLVLAVVGIAVATMGPGRFSLDEVLGIDWSFHPKIGLGVSAGVGIGSAVLLIATCFRPPAKTEG